MKVAVTNIVLLNTGDAAILLGLLKLVREAIGNDVEFVIFDNQPEAAAKYYPELKIHEWPYLTLIKVPKPRKLGKFNMWRFYAAAILWNKGFKLLAKAISSDKEIRAIQEYCSIDLAISTGGTYLVENYSLKPRIFDFNLVLLLEKPLILFTQSLGPFTTPENRKSLLSIFEQCKLILLRDKRSQDNLTAIGLERKNNHVVADAAFALADSQRVNLAKGKKLPSENLKVAISVRDWEHFKTVDSAVGRKNYIEAVCQTVAYLVQKYKAEVTFISTCQGIPEYRDDSKFAQEEILGKLPDDIKSQVHLETRFRRPEEIAVELHKFDFVISTRLHMAILSLGVGVPVLPIAYEFKTQELFNSIGGSELILDIEDITAERTCKNIDLIVNADDAYWNQLFSGVEHQCQSALLAKNLVEDVYKQISNDLH